MHNDVQNPSMQIAEMSRGYVLSRALHAVSRLKIANYLSDKPLDIKAIAQACNCNTDKLNRLMKFLSDYEIFNFHYPNSYSLTELSEVLRDDHPQSMRKVLALVDNEWWEAFSKMDECLQSDVSAFELQHKQHFFEHLAQNKNNNLNYSEGMSKLSLLDEKALIDAYNFQQFNSMAIFRILNIHLALVIAKKFPELKVILCDEEQALSTINREGLPHNIYLLSHSCLFNSEPVDAYFLKGLLHDYDEPTALAMLRTLIKSIAKKSTVLVAEQIIPDHNKPHTNKTMDIIMMVLVNGQQRTLLAWQKLICSVGLRFLNAYTTKSLFTILEFKPSE